MSSEVNKSEEMKKLLLECSSEGTAFIALRNRIRNLPVESLPHLRNLDVSILFDNEITLESFFGNYFMHNVCHEFLNGIGSLPIRTSVMEKEKDKIFREKAMNTLEGLEFNDIVIRFEKRVIRMGIFYYKNHKLIEEGKKELAKIHEKFNSYEFMRTRYLRHCKINYANMFKKYKAYSEMAQDRPNSDDEMKSVLKERMKELKKDCRDLFRRCGRKYILPEKPNDILEDENDLKLAMEAERFRAVVQHKFEQLTTVKMLRKIDPRHQEVTKSIFEHLISQIQVFIDKGIILHNLLGKSQNELSTLQHEIPFYTKKLEIRKEEDRELNDTWIRLKGENRRFDKLMAKLQEQSSTEEKSNMEHLEEEFAETVL